ADAPASCAASRCGPHARGRVRAGERRSASRRPSTRPATAPARRSCRGGRSAGRRTALWLDLRGDGEYLGADGAEAGNRGGERRVSETAIGGERGDQPCRDGGAAADRQLVPV